MRKKEIKLHMGFTDENGNLVKIPENIQKHIEERENFWIDKIKDIDGKCGIVLERLALTEKALELACERVKYFEELQDKEMGFSEFFGYDSDYDLKAIIEQYKDQSKQIADLETQLADLQEEQIAEMKEHQEAMELADNTINNLVEDNRASQEWYKKQLADTEEQNKRVLEKLELIVRANQELEQKLAEKDLKITELETKLNLKDKGINV